MPLLTHSLCGPHSCVAAAYPLRLPAPVGCGPRCLRAFVQAPEEALLKLAAEITVKLHKGL